MQSEYAPSEGTIPGKQQFPQLLNFVFNIDKRHFCFILVIVSEALLPNSSRRAKEINSQITLPAIFFRVLGMRKRGKGRIGNYKAKAPVISQHRIEIQVAQCKVAQNPICGAEGNFPALHPRCSEKIREMLTTRLIGKASSTLFYYQAEL